MPTGAPAALFVNDIINKHINAGHFQAGCMFNFIFNAVGNALRDGSDVQAIPHFTRVIICVPPYGIQMNSQLRV